MLCWFTPPNFTVPRSKIFEAGSEKQGKRHLSASLTNLLSRALFHSANLEALGTEHARSLWMLFNLVSLTFVLSCWSKITCSYLYSNGINYHSHTVSEKQGSPAPISSTRITTALQQTEWFEQESTILNKFLLHCIALCNRCMRNHFTEHNLFHKLKGISNPLVPLQLWCSSLSG